MLSVNWTHRDTNEMAGEWIRDFAIVNLLKYYGTVMIT